MKTRDNQRAFTLIELLTVIAALTVFLAVALPVLQRARSCAKRIRCQSSLKQITLACYAYLDDHDGYFYRRYDNPNYRFGGWVGTPFPEGDRFLNPYVGLPKTINHPSQAMLFKCPSDLGGSDYDRLSPTAFGYFGNSYETNHLMMGPPVPLPFWRTEPWQSLFARINGTGHSLKDTSIKDPARLLFVGDHNWRNQWDPLNIWYCGRSWHGKSHHYNLAFFDGHINLLRVDKGICMNSDYRIHPLVNLNGIVLEKQQAVDCVCKEADE